ncbi:hypothetical protein ASF48_08945 [Rathayibacter sp. Leaf299]|uniref:hypothetical protein n=1 Tax=Rathayibacter sp. Leaf299 TaxID=1736328 RepID=UPI000701B1E1|nr:hypothetical protein [Rathayibacter sp. Leaf299]KQQ20717.1 hypothetical protein ASF48_08945 [Rathayibacter sp. Leaf299]
MSGPDASSDEYRAGYLARRADRQGEVDWLENEADRYYRLAYGDERRLPSVAVTSAELEQRRALSAPPVEATRRDALASWGIETPPHRHSRGRRRERDLADIDGTNEPHEQESQ